MSLCYHNYDMTSNYQLWMIINFEKCVYIYNMKTVHCSLTYDFLHIYIKYMENRTILLLFFANASISFLGYQVIGEGRES